MLKKRDETVTVLGIDGCKGGWLAAVAAGPRLAIKWRPDIEAVLSAYATNVKALIDIPIGLPDSPQQAAFRPDKAARAILGKKYSSVFPAPYRLVAQAKDTNEAWEVNKAVGGNANYMTMGIRKAVAEVDRFLQENVAWQNKLCECHPEVCFTVLNGGTPLIESKKGEVGREKRLNILARWGIKREQFSGHPLYAKHKDDVIDALCLVLVGRLAAKGKTTVIPPAAEIQTDSIGLKMQMVVPVLE